MAIGTNSPTFQLWVRLIRITQRIHCRIDTALKSEGLPPLSWYDVLVELERHEGPLRARDLEQHLLLAQYNLSRLLDRLEEQRLIAREPDPDDGRSRLIRITADGLAMRGRMWPVYRRIIEGSIGKRLTEAQAGEIAALLKPIATS